MICMIASMSEYLTDHSKANKQKQHLKQSSMPCDLVMRPSLLHIEQE